MDLHARLTDLQHGVLRLPPDELAPLIALTTLVREDDTHFAGTIRLLDLDGALFMQEQHPETHELLIRRFDDREAADAFVQERLDTYERMWDGCGCKVHYFD